MKRTIALVEVLMGLWLLASPWFVGYAPSANRFVDMGIGVVIIVLAIVFSVLKGKRLGEKGPNWPLVIIAILGLALIAEGIVGICIGYPVGAIVNEIIVGLIVLLLGIFAVLVPDVKKVSMSGFDNQEILVVQKIYIHKEKDDPSNKSIVMKVKAFGSMPMTVKMSAKNLWMLIGALPFEVFQSLPSMLVKGHKEYKADQE